MCRTVCLSKFACGCEEQQTLWPCALARAGPCHGVPALWYVTACERPDRVAAKAFFDGGMLVFHRRYFCAGCHQRLADALASLVQSMFPTR